MSAPDFSEIPVPPYGILFCENLRENFAKKNGQSAFNVIRAIAYPKAIADGVYLQF